MRLVPASRTSTPTLNLRNRIESRNYSVGVLLGQHDRYTMREHAVLECLVPTVGPVGELELVRPKFHLVLPIPVLQTEAATAGPRGQALVH